MKNNLSHISDSEIISGCKEKQRHFQKLLFLRYSGQILTTCRRYTTNDYPAKDLVQETFIKVFEKIHQYDPKKGTIIGWIRRIAINVAIDNYNKKKIRTVYIDSNIEELIDNSTDDLDDSLSNCDEELIMHLVKNLPQGYQTVFNMYLLDGFSHLEIAKLLFISVSTSKSQLFKAKNMLKKQLFNYRKRRNENFK